MYYDIHYPGEERLSGRNQRLSPTYYRLRDLGAQFGEKSGWNAPTGSSPTKRLPATATSQKVGFAMPGRERSATNT